MAGSKDALRVTTSSSAMDDIPASVATPLAPIARGVDVDNVTCAFPEVIEEFREMLKEKKLSTAVAAIKALLSVINHSKAATLMGLKDELQAVTRVIKAVGGNAISIESGTDLFLRFVTRTSFDIPDFQQCKAILIERGTDFLTMSLKSREKIAAFAGRFIRDNDVILTHGKSRVVTAVLLRAAEQNIHFTVMVTESRPFNSGVDVARVLTGAGIPVTYVLDSCVGAVMERASCVLVGAEAVLESGGVANQVGTYPIAVMANLHKKPVYIAVESFKFVRMYPLSQSDMPVPTFGAKEIVEGKVGVKDIPEEVTVEVPTIDLTPPDLITLLFTDLGVVTSSAVSDELIKLYY